MAAKRGKAKRIRGIRTPRPALIQACSSTEDHPGHTWRFSEDWPPDAYWWCRGYNREQAQRHAIATEKAVRHIRKRDKVSRARWRRKKKLLDEHGITY